MNKSDIDYIIEKLESYKPDNIYNGYNSEREKQDQRVSEVLDSIIAEIKSDYENMRTPTPKELVLTLSPKQMEETKEHIDELVKQFVEDIEIKYNWIKCSEKMPENGKNVLVAIKNNRYSWIDIGYIEEYGWWTIGGEFWDRESDPAITHWMLLPEPPEVE